MARIVGVVSHCGINEASLMFSRLRQDFGGGSRNRHYRSFGPASFSWIETGPVTGSVKDGVMVVVDGRFYNVDELEVSANESVAEQFIVLYRRHGFPEALARINGDFAVALFEQRSNSFWLGRDRVGHRPLYYVQTKDGLAFSSRPSRLLNVPGVSPAINQRWVAVFAGSHYRYIDNRPEESPFEAVRQLPAATAVEFTDGVLRQVRYWTLEEQAEFTEDEPTLALRYRDLLLDAVKQRLNTTSRPAFTLSGGMDSSSVLACAVELTGQKQIAFSSVYADRTYDESADIKDFVGEKVAQWHTVSIENFDLFGTVRQMVRAHDEPVATATWLSHFLLCGRVAMSGFDTLFGGLGGDELNAGEYEYFVFHFADLEHNGDKTRLAHEINEWSSHHNHPIYRKNREVAERLLARLADPSVQGRVRVEQERLTRYFPAVSHDYFDLTMFEPLLDHPFRSWLKNRTYQDMFRETTPCCLRAEDRNCATWGLDHVDPFFDHRLMEFMFRVPGSMKIRDGVTKRLLREAMKGLLPEDTRTRIKKTGWNAPAHIWFLGKETDQLLDLVHSRVFRERGVYNVSEVLKLVEEHRFIVKNGSVRENHMMFLWQLVNLELWFQEVVDRQSVSATAAIV